MSDITNASFGSDMSPPVHCSTLKLQSEDANVVLRSKLNANESTTPKEITNNLKPNLDCAAEAHLVKLNNNSNLVKTKNLDECIEKLDGNDNKSPKLKLVVSTSDENGLATDDLSKTRSPILQRNASQKDASTPNLKYSRPIMGRSALLKKADIERSDSVIVHDIITDKYNGVLTQYYGRVYQRRRSRLASDDDYSDTMYSSTANSSPSLSISSINTPGSLPVDERTGFLFPNAGQSSDYRFIVSTDDANIETTVEDLTESSVISTDTGNEKSMTSVSEYDPRKFLENAIGDVTNLSDESGICKGVAECDVNPPEDQSVRTSDLSALISRASSLYSSMKRNVKKRCSMKLSESALGFGYTKDKRLSSPIPNNSYLETLQKELSRQNVIMFQVSKALTYCRTMKEFEASRELIEAEKILLVASCTKDALTQEMHNVEDEGYEKRDAVRSCGEVELSNVKFFLKDCVKSESHRDFTEHFLAIFTCGSMVQASTVIEASENGVVAIEKSFKFTKLSSDFEIAICVYSMSVGHKVHQHQEQKLHCPSAKKIFSHSKRYKVISDECYKTPSSFSLCGKYEIRSQELSKIKQTEKPFNLTLKMYNTPLSSTLSSTFSMNIQSDVKLANKMNGFLTIGTDNEHGCTIWNRRWCVLEAYVLKYWNYPSEEVTTPLGYIDLTYCLDQQVETADRSTCARPRTLMLPVQHKETFKKYFLSADSFSEMKQWDAELNSVIRSLRIWNCMNSRS